MLLTATETKSFKFKAVLISLLMSFTLMSIVPAPALGQNIFNLPVPGTVVNLSPGFVPVMLRGLKVYPDNPFKFDFIVDSGNSGLAGDELKAESEKLARYFLATLTTPEEDLWVNLSPYESDRIIPEALGQTEMGQELLAQDYILKQVTASLMLPDSETGKEFWAKVYKQAYAKFGTTNIPVDTFNKVWIVPEKAVVYEDTDKALVTESHLKVMLETDYLAQANSVQRIADSNDKGLNAQRSTLNTSSNSPSSGISSDIVREILIPLLEKEVNVGKNFAKLRQMFHAMVLATWYKTALKESILNKVYGDKRKIKGLKGEGRRETLEKVNPSNIKDSSSSLLTSNVYPLTSSNLTSNVSPLTSEVDQIYSQYLAAYKKGVCNIMKVEFDPYAKKHIPRKYFSGGFMGGGKKLSSAIITRVMSAFSGFSKFLAGTAFVVSLMLASPDFVSARTIDHGNDIGKQERIGLVQDTAGHKLDVAPFVQEPSIDGPSLDNKQKDGEEEGGYDGEGSASAEKVSAYVRDHLPEELKDIVLQLEEKLKEKSWVNPVNLGGAWEGNIIKGYPYRVYRSDQIGITVYLIPIEGLKKNTGQAVFTLEDVESMKSMRAFYRSGLEIETMSSLPMQEEVLFVDPNENGEEFEALLKVKAESMYDYNYLYWLKAFGGLIGLASVMLAGVGGYEGSKFLKKRMMNKLYKVLSEGSRKPEITLLNGSLTVKIGKIRVVVTSDSIKLKNFFHLSIRKDDGGRYFLALTYLLPFLLNPENPQLSQIEDFVYDCLRSVDFNHYFEQGVKQNYVGIYKYKSLAIGSYHWQALFDFATEKIGKTLDDAARGALAGTIAIALVNNRSLKPTQDQLEILLNYVSDAETSEKTRDALSKAIGEATANNPELISDVFLKLEEATSDFVRGALAETIVVVFRRNESVKPTQDQLEILLNYVSDPKTSEKTRDDLSLFSAQALKNNPNLQLNREQFKTLTNSLYAKTTLKEARGDLSSLVSQALANSPDLLSDIFKELSQTTSDMTRDALSHIIAQAFDDQRNGGRLCLDILVALSDAKFSEIRAELIKSVKERFPDLADAVFSNPATYTKLIQTLMSNRDHGAYGETALNFVGILKFLLNTIDQGSFQDWDKIKESVDKMLSNTDQGLPLLLNELFMHDGWIKDLEQFYFLSNGIEIFNVKIPRGMGNLASIYFLSWVARNGLTMSSDSDISVKLNDLRDYADVISRIYEACQDDTKRADLRRLVMSGSIKPASVLEAVYHIYLNSLMTLTTSVVKKYEGTRKIPSGMVTIESKLQKHSFDNPSHLKEFIVDIFKDTDVPDSLEEFLKFNDLREYDNTIMPKYYNLLTSVYRAFAEQDHIEANYLSYALTTVIFNYLRKGGEAQDLLKGGIGPKALHEFDVYFLEAQQVVDPNVAGAVHAVDYGRHPVEEYARKRSITAGDIIQRGDSVENQTGNPYFFKLLTMQKNERIAKDNIFYIFQALVNGQISKDRFFDVQLLLDQQIEILKDKQKTGLRDEYLKLLLGRIKDSGFEDFLKELLEKYREGKDNRDVFQEILSKQVQGISLVRRYHRHAKTVTGRIVETEKLPIDRTYYQGYQGDTLWTGSITSVPVFVDHPWVEKKKTLLDYFENIQEMRKDTPEEGDYADVYLEDLMLKSPRDQSQVDVQFSSKGLTFLAKKLKVSLSEAERRRATVSDVISSLSGLNLGASIVNQGSVGRGTDLPGKYDIDVMVFAPNGKTTETARSILSVLELNQRFRNIRYQPSHTEETDLISFKVMDADLNEVLAEVEISVGTKKSFYADIFNDQMTQVKEKFGEQTAEGILSDIRVMKYLMQQVIRSYKWYHGGLKGVGVEQLIIQSGETTENGRVIAKPGSLDQALKKIYDAGYDKATNRIRPLSQASQNFIVIDEKGGNCLGNMNEASYKRLVHMAKVYVESQLAGQDVALELFRYTLESALSYRNSFAVVEISLPRSLISEIGHKKFEYERVDANKIYVFLKNQEESKRFDAFLKNWEGKYTINQRIASSGVFSKVSSDITSKALVKDVTGATNLRRADDKLGGIDLDSENLDPARGGDFFKKKSQSGSPLEIQIQVAKQLILEGDYASALSFLKRAEKFAIDDIDRKRINWLRNKCIDAESQGIRLTDQDLKESLSQEIISLIELRKPAEAAGILTERLYEQMPTEGKEGEAESIVRAFRENVFDPIVGRLFARLRVRAEELAQNTADPGYVMNLEGLKKLPGPSPLDVEEFIFSVQGGMPYLEEFSWPEKLGLSEDPFDEIKTISKQEMNYFGWDIREGVRNLLGIKGEEDEEGEEWKKSLLSKDEHNDQDSNADISIKGYILKGDAKGFMNLLKGLSKNSEATGQKTVATLKELWKEAVSSKDDPDYRYRLVDAMIMAFNGNKDFSLLFLLVAATVEPSVPLEDLFSNRLSAQKYYQKEKSYPWAFDLRRFEDKIEKIKRELPEIFYPSTDAKVVASSSNVNKDLGGIDLNSDNLELKRTGSSPIQFNLPAEWQGVDLEKIPGFVPVIIGITPIINFNALLGLPQFSEGGNSIEIEASQIPQVKFQGDLGLTQDGEPESIPALSKI